MMNETEILNKKEKLKKELRSVYDKRAEAIEKGDVIRADRYQNIYDVLVGQIAILNLVLRWGV